MDNICKIIDPYIKGSFELKITTFNFVLLVIGDKETDRYQIILYDCNKDKYVEKEFLSLDELLQGLARTMMKFETQRRCI